MILVTGGPGTLGYNLDVFEAVGIFAVVGIMATILLFSNMSLKDKFSLMATPLSILFLGIIFGLFVRSIQSSTINIKLVQ